MINQDKVKLMARIQHFENTEKEAIKANSMYQRDYLGLYMLRSLCAYILLALIAGAGFCMFHLDTMLSPENLDASIAAVKGLALGFGLLMIPIMIVSYIIYWFRYRKAMKKMKGHMDNMRKLKAYYDQNEESGEGLKKSV